LLSVSAVAGKLLDFPTTQATVFSAEITLKFTEEGIGINKDNHARDVASLATLAATE
jgi:hypothetical protein